MRVIRDIGLQLDYEENLHTPRQYTSDFSFRSRFIGNYLKRQIKQSKFVPTGYTRLVINACHIIKPNRIFENCLCVSIFFDKALYDNMKNGELPDFFIDMYIDGINQAKLTDNIPVAFLNNKLKEFKADGYKNEWEFKSKTFKEIGIKTSLFCKMTMDTFTLSLTLYKKKELIFEREILTTLPDETCYHYQFKDVILENNTIIITSWYDAPPLYLLDLSF